MNNYQIITDSGCDMPRSVLEKLNVRYVPLYVNFRGQTLEDSVDMGIKDIYAGLRTGEAASTSAINPEGWKTAMEPVVAAGQDALVLTFSSGLSTTYQSAVIAARELEEAYPERKIRVVDSLCASLGQGLLLYYACQKRDLGLSLDELADWLEDNKLHLCHWFTVDDLMYLKRGGRVSAATALVGTMLQIKPVLHVDDEGHLINVSKTRGRKASIQALAGKMAETALPGENDLVYICHGDCLEDAEYLAQLIREKCGVREVFIGYTGAVIGSHSGPGTLALFYLGTNR
ncbi:MAG: DegV family protein [Ruminococcaceae bacterium]|nr:DegV family protein [Oscillospiraceae bacterium]